MLVAYREWRVQVLADDLRPVLVSTYMSTVWLDSVLEADQEPETDMSRGLGNLHGVHAVVPDYPRGVAESLFLRRSPGPWHEAMALGAVELSGTVVEHADGVLRASRARVLALRFVPPRFRCSQQGCKCLWLTWFTGHRQGPPPLPPVWELVHPCFSDRHRDAPTTNDEEVAQQRGHPVPQVYPYTVEEIDRMLRERYEVPRLPENDGPWPRLWAQQQGSGC